MHKSILMVFEGLSHGGAERHIVDVAGGIQNLGEHKIIVATNGGALESELSDKNVLHEIIPGKRYSPTHLLKAAYAISALVKKHNIDIIHSHSRYYNLVSLLAIKLFHLAAMRVATVHNVYPDKHWLGFWPSNTICVSTAAEEYVLKHANTKTRVILNGIPELHPERNSQDLRQQLGIAPDTHILLNIGRLSEQKAQHLLIEAFFKVINTPDTPPLHLLIAGEGELRQRLEEDIKQFSLDDKISLLGSRDDIGDLINASDIFVLSSRWEGLGIVLIEAASLGLPLISFKTGGVVEVVHHNKTGLLVEPEDITGMSEAIVKLINNPKLRQEMGAAGKELYEKNFTIDKCVYETNRFYSDVTKTI